MAKENEQNPVTYDMVVRCTINNKEENFYFDYVEDNTTNLSSDITSYPLVSGDVVADHMYVNPSTVSFNGTFSLIGNKKANKEYNFGSLDRLSNIQEIFEKIMRDGIMCSLIKMGSNGDKSRFKVRNNMVLTSITWIEKQVSLDFNFTFTEALTSVVDEEDYEVDVLDESLPVVSDPLSLNVTDELLDRNEIIQYTIAILDENGLFEENFLETAINWCVERQKGALAGKAVGLVAGTIAAAVAIKVMATIFGGCLAIPGPGWIAAAAIAATAVVVGMVCGIIKTWKKSKYKIKQFKKYEKEKKLEAEINRFLEFIGQIELELENLEDKMSLYGFGQDTPQQCFVNIDNQQYVFTFSKSTSSSNYSLDVINVDETNIANVTDISEKAIVTLGECNNDTLLFNTSSGCQVYLANRQLYYAQQVQQEYSSFDELEDVEGGVERVDEITKDLSKYAILSSTIDLTKFKETVQEIIKSQIFK